MKTRTFYSMCIVLILLTMITAPALAMAPGEESPPVAPSPLLQILGEVLGLSALLFAFVAWLKQAGVSGVWLTVSSLGGGWFIGGLIRYATKPPVTISEWIWLFLYGFIAGLVASGAYKGFEFSNKTDPESLSKARVIARAETLKIVAAVEAPCTDEQLPS